MRMKQSKITVFVVEMGGRSRKEKGVICFFITFLVVFFTTRSINDQLKEFKVSGDYTKIFSPKIHRPVNPSSFSVPRFNDDSNGARPYPNHLWHSVGDRELMRVASEVSRIAENDDSYGQNPPKVAFMFLTRGRLPLATLWEMFFEGHESNFFSIYLHTSPEFNDEPSKSSVFYKRRIPSKAVEWGKSTMMDAERRLLANALLDSRNQRFVLLSETCIPLFSFTTIYDYLINSDRSFLGCFDDPRAVGRGRYSKKMWPAVSLSDWRKGSQWFEVNRQLALAIISDVKYYNLFRSHCQPPCYMDEHYLPTLVTKINPRLTTNTTVTWMDWSRGGSHPTTFVANDVSEEFVDNLRFGFNCSYNGRFTSICFLFARKFHPTTLQPLLKMAPKLFGLDPKDPKENWVSMNKVF